MNDPDFIKLRNRVLIGILIVLAFLIPLIFLFINKFDAGSSKLIKKINKEESVTVLLTSPDCKTCKEIEKLLSSKNVNYYKLDISKKNEYQEFLQRLTITEKEVVLPTIMYINEGNLVATLVEVKDDEDLNDFIENYGLDN